MLPIQKYATNIFRCSLHTMSLQTIKKSRGMDIFTRILIKQMYVRVQECSKMVIRRFFYVYRTFFLLLSVSFRIMYLPSVDFFPNKVCNALCEFKTSTKVCKVCRSATECCIQTRTKLHTY